MNREEEIRELLREFVEYDNGKRLREELKDIADKTYIQKYSDKEQIDFLDRHEASIKILHAQSTNFPYYLQMFTVLTQHIYADNIRQVIDKGIDIELEQKLWTKKEPLDISFEMNEETVDRFNHHMDAARYVCGGLVNGKKYTPKMRKPPKQQMGFGSFKPLKLKDWQEFVLVYIISAIISYLILAFIKMDTNLIQWNPFYRALVGFYIPTFILILWIKSKSK